MKNQHHEKRLNASRFSFTALSRGKRNGRRKGFTYAEVLVSATILTTIMSLVTVSSFRISRVWKDVRQQKIALNELSNHLDRLTALPVDDACLLYTSPSPRDRG